MLLEGDGTPSDEKQGISWIRRAAEGDNAQAQYILGQCYLEGELVDKNVDLAKKYLEMAAAQGVVEARELLNSGLA